MSVYQPALFDYETMQRRDGTRSGHLRLPKGMARGDCVGGAAARARGEQSCPFLACKYHLVPELVKLRPKGAIDAMARRLSGDIRHSCSLDLADSGPCEDSEIADALGIDRQLVPQRAAEAMHRLHALAKLDRDTRENINTVNVRAEENRTRRRSILRARSGGMTAAEVAEEFCVTVSAVEDIWTDPDGSKRNQRRNEDIQRQ